MSAITHTFRGGKDPFGYGYFAYIADGQLVIGESWPNEGGITYSGGYYDAAKHLEELKIKARQLYDDIEKYFIKHDPDSSRFKSNKTVKLCDLNFGDKFIRVSSKDLNFKDNTPYMLIDMNVSKCFVFGDKLSCFATALDLNDFKVYIFDKTTEVKLIQEDKYETH